MSRLLILGSVLLVAGVTIGGCQNTDQQSTVDVVVKYRPNQQQPWEQVAVQCPGSQSPALGCQQIEDIDDQLWEEPDERQICTMIYGGQQQAEVRGMINGQKIEARFSRAGGCQIARWKQLAELLETLDLESRRPAN